MKFVGGAAKPSTSKAAVIDHDKRSAKPKSNGRAVKPPTSKPEVIVIKPDYRAKFSLTRIGHFPRYADTASVYIHVAKHKKYDYVFDKSTLVRNSESFAHALEGSCEEPDPKIADHCKKAIGYEFRFELVQCEETSGWILKRSVSWVNSRPI